MAKQNGTQKDKLDYSAFKKAEADFLFNELSDLPRFVTAFGFEEIKSQQPNKQRDFQRGNDKITMTKGHSRWVWCVHGREKSKLEETAGLIAFCIEYNNDQNKVGAFATLRKYAKANHLAAYTAFHQNFRKQNPGEPVINLDMIQVSGNEYKPTASHTVIAKEKEVATEFNFRPGNDFSFILDRGITLETVTHPLFQGRFGNSDGPFGKENKEKVATDQIYTYKNHLIVPLTNFNDQVVGLEAKNKLTNEAYEHQLSQFINDGDVRRNPSKIYVGSSHKTGFWRSNIPENPTHIFIAEQPMDALSFFQIHREESYLENTIFLTTGGTPTEEHLAAITGYIEKHNITHVISGFDNDRHGLSYSVKLIGALGEKLPGAFQVHIPNRKENQLLDLEFKSIDRIESIDAAHRQITDIISASGLIGEYFPDLKAGDGSPENTSIGVFSFQYTGQNAAGAFKVAQHYSGKPLDFFSLAQPEQSKDWNDVLQGKQNIGSEIVLKSLFDTEDNKNKIIIDPKGNILLSRRLVSFDQNIKEPIGKFNPYARKHFFKISEGVRLPENVKREIESANRTYQNQVPAITEEWLKKTLAQGITYRAGLFYKAGNTIAVLSKEANGFTPSENYNLTELEKMALKWMSAAALRNLDISPLLSLDFRDIYYFREDNKDLHCSEPTLRKGGKKGERIVYATLEVARLDHQSGKWALVNVSYKVSELQQAFLNSLNEQRSNVPDGVQIDLGTGKVTVTMALAEISLSGIDKTNVVLTGEDTKIISRMAALIQKGLDPNRPGFIGRLEEGYKINFAPNYENRLSEAGMAQLTIFIEAMDSHRAKMGGILEKYPEPIVNLSSENLCLYEHTPSGKKPIVQFNHETQALNWLIPIEELESRSFNPFFFKSLVRFTENQGIFHNYIRLINVSDNKLYYNNTNAEIGILFKVEGITKYCLRDGIPPALVREMEIFSPYPKASNEEVKRTGVSLESAKMREIKVEAIPMVYATFFDSRGKLNYKGESELQELQRKNPEKYNRYLEAEIWNLNHNQSKKEEARSILNSASVGIVDNKGILKLGRLQVAAYNPKTDQFDYAFQPSHKYYSQLGLFERIYVKDPANRKYAAYIFENNTEPEKTSQTEIMKELAGWQHVTSPSGKQEIYLMHKPGNYFEKLKVAEIKDNQLLVEKEILNFSPLMEEALKFLAEQKKFILVETEFKNAPGATLELKKPDITIKENYSHELQTTRDSILEGLQAFPALKDKIGKNEEKRMTLRLPQGNSVEVNELNGPVRFASNWPSERKFIVIAEKPEQLLLWSQQNYHIALHDQVYLSTMSDISYADQRIQIDRLVKTNPAQKVVLIGNESFQNNVGEKLNYPGVTIEKIPEIETIKSLEPIQGLVNQFKEDKNLQSMLEACSGSIFSPVPGVAIIPMQSTASKSMTYLSTVDKPSVEINSVWVHGNIQTCSQVTLLPTVREGVAYLAINEGYAGKQCLISFNSEKPTREAISYVTELIKRRVDLVDKIYVGNTKGLAEKLEEEKFPFQFKVRTTQYKALTYQEEFLKVSEGLKAAGVQLSLMENKRYSGQELKSDALARTTSSQGRKKDIEVDLTNTNGITIH